MLTTSQSFVQYQGNGATTSFPFNFLVQQASYLVATITNNNVVPPVETVLATTQYTATGFGNTSGGTVTYPSSGSPLPSGWTITIQRVVPAVQNTSLSNQGAFYPQVVEAALDYLTCAIQQLQAAATGMTALQGTPGTGVVSGTVNPVNGTTGIDGDFYINTATWTVFGPRVAGVWPAGVSMLGATGSSGNTVWNGTIAPGSGLGANGDFYINTATSTIYGPKASGAWPGGVSLVGQTGQTGAAGSPGVSWQGQWSATTAYTLGQGVSYNGYGWVCVVANTGQVPGAGTGWTPIVFGEWRNRMLNGEFRIDRLMSGASLTLTAGANPVYVTDQWIASCTGANLTGQRVANLTVNQFQYCYQFTGAASNTGLTFGQRIESVNIEDLGNSQSQVTFSFYADAQGGAPTTLTWAAYYPITLDSWPAANSIQTGNITITSVQQQYSVTFTLPLSAVNGLMMTLSTGPFTSGTLHFTGCQTEAGAMASPFDRRPDDIESFRCSKYLPGFTIGTGQGTVPFIGQANTATTASFYIPFAIPSATHGASGLYSSAATGFNVYNAAGTAYNVSAIVLAYISPYGVLISVTCATGLTAGQAVILHSTNPAYLFVTGFQL